MDITKLKFKTIRANRNIVSLAAQYHCVRMYDDRNDCSTGAVVGELPAHKEITLPENAPDWILSLVDDNSVSIVSEKIWNKITREERSNGHLAREVAVGLPVELSREQNIALVKDFVLAHIVKKGVIADWVFYNGDQNPYMRLLQTLRPVERGGFGKKKNAVLGADGNVLKVRGHIVYQTLIGGPKDLINLRKGWLDLLNRHLENAGHESKVCGRPYYKRETQNVSPINIDVAHIDLAQRQIAV